MCSFRGSISLKGKSVESQNLVTRLPYIREKVSVGKKKTPRKELQNMIF